MALDPAAVATYGTPEWWMVTLSRQLLDRRRLLRFGILEAYRAGCPPLVTATESQRTTFHAFTRVSRTAFADTVVRSPAERMSVRSIKTAAVDDDAGDQVAWRYWTGSGLNTAERDVTSDMLTYSEAYVRVGLDDDDGPIALRRDPRFIITAQDPMNPMETIAGLELLWDEWTNTDYAYLDLKGEQWVAVRQRKNRPPLFAIPGVTNQDRQWAGLTFFPRLSFDANSFTMRPMSEDVPDDEQDTLPYSRRFDSDKVAVVPFYNRDGVGEFEKHLDLLDRISMMTMLLMVTMGVQAFKQRSLEQDVSDGPNTEDRLPQINPETGEPINWDEIFQPGPDALWKLPPGVHLKESGQVDLQGLSMAIKDALRDLSNVTGTPFSQFSPDGINQSAEGVTAGRESLVFKVEDRNKITERAWASVVSLLLTMAPDSDRYAGDGDARIDRADAGRIVIDATPAERFSLFERAQADSLNRTLSKDMAAAKIWGLTPDEVAINRTQRNADALTDSMAVAVGQTGGTTPAG